MRRQVSYTQRRPPSDDEDTLIAIAASHSPDEAAASSKSDKKKEKSIVNVDGAEIKNGGVSGSQLVSFLFVLVLLLCFLSQISHSKLRKPASTTSRITTVGNQVLDSAAMIRNPIDVKHPPTWIAGMVLDADEIQNRIWEFLIELNCDHNIGIHILVKYNADKGQTMVEELKTEHLQSVEKVTSTTCASPFIMLEEEQQEEPLISTADGKKPKMNRIDRIAKMRDFQRGALQDIFVEGSNVDRGVLILADFDLLHFPPIPGIIKQVRDFRRLSYPHDAICALGTVMLKQKVEMKHEEEKRMIREEKMSSWKVKMMQKIIKLIGETDNFKITPVTGDGEEEENGIALKSFRSKIIPHYYDIFATIFKPDTFAYPYAGRLIQKPYKGENPDLVRSDDEHGKYTQADMYKYLIKEAKESSSTGNLSVRSCFGGFAMYRTKAYFHPKCRYQLRLSQEEITKLDQGEFTTPLLRYANMADRRPCEHVVFHECLSENKPDFDIAVNPKLPSIWSFDT